VIRLYVIPGSVASIAAELMLKRKGIEYRRRDLIPGVHMPIVRLLGFPDRTVPALKSDSRKVQGSRPIARFLDELKPEPSLFPTDPERRAAVEEAERWGDQELQSVPRRLVWFALRRDRSTVKEFFEGYRVGVPASVAAATAGSLVWVEQRVNRANPTTVRADLEHLPALLDHVDELLAQGVIGGDEPNAADYQIAPSVRLLLAFDQLRPLIEGRPAGVFAARVVPVYHGHVPPTLPFDWVPSRLSRSET
jgi:glutathione S-transferase